MSLLPHNATLHERVQDCFVAYRGRGVSLSTTDFELLDLWANTGAPFEVIARGIRKAAEEALWHTPKGEASLQSLAWCRKAVRSEIDKYLKRSIGRTEAPDGAVPPEPLHLTRHKKLLSVLKKLRKRRPELLRWLPSLTVPDDLTRAERNEHCAMARLLRALPEPSRSELLREARRLVHKTATLSATARRESLRFHRAALVRRELSLPTFW